MPRKYHSPSSIELGRRCKRAWYYRYVEGIRRPEIEWREDLKGRDRSLALGKALHATLEAHFTPGGNPNWLWFPGEVAASGVALLPPQNAPVAVESGIGSRGTGTNIGPGRDGRQRFTVTIAGVPWLGYRDLTLDHADDCALGLSAEAGCDCGAADRPFLYDYKSTRSIDRYAKSVAELLQDLQANLYAYDTMTELNTDELLCRWVYFETDRKRQAEPRDFVVKRAEAFSVIECAAEIAKELDLIDSIDQAPTNPSACPDYGGCEFHVKAGGPCSASVPVGALIQARVPKKGSNQMPLKPSSLANLGNRFPNPNTAVPAGPAAVVTQPTAPAPETPATTQPEQQNPPAAPEVATPRGRPRKGVGAAGSFAELGAALASAEANAAQALAELEAAKENMRKALA